MTDCFLLFFAILNVVYLFALCFFIFYFSYIILVIIRILMILKKTKG